MATKAELSPYVKRAYEDLGANHIRLRDDPELKQKVFDLAELYERAEKDENVSVRASETRKATPWKPVEAHEVLNTEREFPGFRKEIREFRAEGLKETDIKGKIAQWAQDRINEGYDVEEVKAKMRGPQPTMPKDWKDVGGFLTMLKEAVTQPADDRPYGRPRGQALRGFVRGLTGGYLGGEQPEPENSRDVVEQMVGELAGAGAPMGAAFKAVQIPIQAATRALPGLRALARLKMGKQAAQATQAGLETAAATAVASGLYGAAYSQPDDQTDIGKRVQAGVEATIHPLNLIGAGAAGGLHALHAAGAYKTMERAFYEMKKRQPPTPLQTEVTGTVPEATPTAPAPVSPEPGTTQTFAKLNDAALLSKLRGEIHSKGRIDNLDLATELDKRGKDNFLFRNMMERVVGESEKTYKARVLAEEKVRIKDQMPEIELLKTDKPDLTGIVPDELIKIEERLQTRLDKSKVSGDDKAYQRTAALLQKVREAIPADRLRQASAPPPPPTQTQSTTGLPVERVITADYIRRVAVTETEGRKQFLLQAYEQTPDGSFKEIGLSRIPEEQYAQLDPNRVHATVPTKIFKTDPIFNRKENPRQYADTLIKAERLFTNPNDLIVTSRIQNALGMTEYQALQVANDLRIKRGQGTQISPIAGGSLGQPGTPERAANVQAAIREYEMMLQRMKPGSANYKMIEALVKGLEREGKIADPLATALFGIKKTAADSKAPEGQPPKKPFVSKEAERLRQEKAVQPVVDEEMMGEIHGSTPFDIQRSEMTALRGLDKDARDMHGRPLHDLSGVPDTVAPTPEVQGTIVRPLSEPVKPITSGITPESIGDQAQVVYFDLRRSTKVPSKQWNPMRPEEADALAIKLREAAEALGITDYRVDIRPLPNPTPMGTPRAVGGEAANITARRARVTEPSRPVGEEIPVGTERDLDRATRTRNLPTDVSLTETAGSGPGVSTKALEVMSANKGFEFQQIWEGPGKPSTFKLVRSDGSELVTQDLPTVMKFLMMMEDSADPRVANKFIAGGSLSPQERLAVEKIATEANTIKPKSQEPLLPPPPDPPDATLEQLGPPPPQPIQGGSGNSFIDAIATQRGLSEGQMQKLDRAYALLVQKYGPDMHAAFLHEWAKPHARMASPNPIDYFPSAQPQSHWNPIIRAVAKEALMELELPRGFEFKQWIDYANKNWANLTPDELNVVTRQMKGSVPPGTVANMRPEVQMAYEAAKKWVDDVAQRLGADDDWIKYIKGMTDFNTIYKGLRPQILQYKDLYDPNMPGPMKDALWPPQSFKMVRRALEKQEDWNLVPKDVKRIIRNKLLTLAPETDYAALPDYVKQVIPKKAWETFPLGGGMPLTENWATIFQNLAPLIMDKLYAEPFFARWDPLVQSLPEGRINSTRTYLEKYLGRLKGSRDSSMFSVDPMIEWVENKLGRHITDEQMLERMMSVGGQWIYRSTIGLALDTPLQNQFQHFNTWVESGRIPSQMKRYFADPKVKESFDQIKDLDVGILQEMQHYMFQHSNDPTNPMKIEGIGSQRWREWDQFVTKWSMKPMAISESFLRGAALMAGMESALKQGLDFQHALLMGYARASHVFQPLALTKAAQEAMMTVQKTQFGYGVASQGPHFQSPPVKLLTLFHSYPVKQLQMVSNGFGLEFNKMLQHHPDFSGSRMFRYTVLAGLTTSILSGLALKATEKIGIEMPSMTSLLPNLMGVTLKPLALAYQMFMGQERVTTKQWNDAAKNLIHHIGLPGQRYWHEKVGYYLAGENPRGTFPTASRGYTINERGQRMYDTDWSELSRLTGMTWGRAAELRIFDRHYHKLSFEWQEEQKHVLTKWLKTQDIELVEKFNNKWGPMHPELALNAADLSKFAMGAEMPFQVRGMKIPQMVGTMNRTGMSP